MELYTALYIQTLPFYPCLSPVTAHGNVRALLQTSQVAEALVLAHAPRALQDIKQRARGRRSGWPLGSGVAKAGSFPAFVTGGASLARGSNSKIGICVIEMTRSNIEE